MEHVHQTRIRVSKGGRIVIPASVRECLNIKVGEELVLTVEGNRAMLMNARAARREARELVQKYIAPDVNLARQLMDERKIEAKNE